MNEWVSIKDFAETVGTSVEFIRTMKDRETFVPYRKYTRSGCKILLSLETLKIIKAYKNRDFSCDCSKLRRKEMGV